MYIHTHMCAYWHTCIHKICSYNTRMRSSDISELHCISFVRELGLWVINFLRAVILLINFLYYIKQIDSMFLCFCSVIACVKFWYIGNLSKILGEFLATKSLISCQDLGDHKLPEILSNCSDHCLLPKTIFIASLHFTSLYFALTFWNYIY